MTDESYRDFDVSLSDHLLGACMSRARAFWLRVGDLETSTLSDEIREVRIDRPVYVSGLARSGSTVLLETLAAAPGVATHRYRDFPLIYTPVWWNRFLDLVPRRSAAPTERSHRDGIAITPESPEAIEEPLWMTFFPDAHDPTRRNVLDAATSNPAFERFYRGHIRKLLLVRHGQRYVSKANYNVTRLEYLLKLFPDARFVVPVREPSSHIASLMKQHALFRRALKNNPRGLDYLRRIGHFEFGLDRRPINLGDRDGTFSVIELWNRDEEVRGWARYWSQIYRYVIDSIDANPAIFRATALVRFEDMCMSAPQTLTRLFDHCEMEAGSSVVEAQAERLHFPSYYRPDLSAQDRAIIAEETQETASRYGY